MTEVPAQAMTRSSRDSTAMRVALEAWLSERVGSPVTIPDVEATSANGMSSETVLLDATWDGVTSPLVVRIAPDEHDVPVFPTYDMARQFEVIRLVGELTDVPVPPVRWCETDRAVLGSPFFVMDRVDGIVPPDVMPYNFGDSWLYDASPDEQRRLQDTTIRSIAGLHQIDRPTERFAFLAFDEPGDTPLRRHFAHTRNWYEFVAADGHRSTLIERGFEWLEAHFPAAIDDQVLSWGDARIGNVMYRDFEPVAVLDWEMACLGPPELDVLWTVYAHHVFEVLARKFRVGGMPDFFRQDDAAATYHGLTGHTLRACDWFLTYAATQFAIVFLRTGTRQIHFGEIAAPGDLDDLLHNGEDYARMLDTTPKD